jgi:tRNA-dihydrouridine synthase
MSKPFFILAPMDDVTDTVFRRIVHDCAPADYYVTEFVNVDGLCSPGRLKLMPKLGTINDKGKVFAQIWGKIPENFEQIAREISEGTIPGFSGIDLNFGCPEKSVVKNECCSALAQPKFRSKAVKIIKATQKGAGSASRRMPISIKTRLGFGEVDYSWHKLLLEQKPSMLTVHVRTTKEMSKVPARWDAIDEVVRLRDEISPETKIVLNGDIENRKQGEELAKNHKVDGIMIGRGIFHDPYCFASVSRARPWKQVDKTEKVSLLIKHVDLFIKTWPNGERNYNTLKKFVKVYITGFDGASELRDRIMHTNSPEEALELLKKL